MTVQGSCDPRFQRVRDAFARNFEAHGELGASVCVVEQGRSVVDLWGGFQDAARSNPWERDTLATVFSVSKGVTSLALALLVERGTLDPEALVADYWPEFAAAGKQHVRVSQLLSHQAGLPSLRTMLPVDSHLDWNAMTAALAAAEPWWKPGSALGYHGHTWGWLAGELLRRIDGRTPGTFVREELAAPLGIEFHIGTPVELDPRIASVVAPGFPVAGGVLLYWLRTPGWTSMRAKLFINPPQEHGKVDSRAWRACEMPSSNGISHARSLATLFDRAARGEVVSAATLERVTQMCSEGRDLVFGFASRFGLGFMLDSKSLGIGGGPRVFGHTGASGAFAFGDPERGLGYAYVPNRMHVQHGLLVNPARDLLRAIYASV